MSKSKTKSDLILERIDKLQESVGLEPVVPEKLPASQDTRLQELRNTVETQLRDIRKEVAELGEGAKKDTSSHLPSSLPESTREPPPTPPPPPTHTKTEPVNAVKHVFDCPECRKDLYKSLSKMEGICKECGLPVTKEFESCPNCGSTKGTPKRRP